MFLARKTNILSGSNPLLNQYLNKLLLRPRLFRRITRIAEQLQILDVDEYPIIVVSGYYGNLTLRSFEPELPRKIHILHVFHSLLAGTCALEPYTSPRTPTATLQSGPQASFLLRHEAAFSHPLTLP